jgi:Cd2+/Zn2+-exporting ATPase
MLDTLPESERGKVFTQKINYNKYHNRLCRETNPIPALTDDISKLPYLFALSRKTMGIIKQNISIAILVKLLCVVLAVMGIITLMMSVGLGDLGLTILVILNSFRIGMVKDPLF